MAFNKGRFKVFFKAHAVFRAGERNIPWELIESTVKTGRFEKYGKNGIKIWKRFRRGKLTCVGQVLPGNYIKIMTITFG